MLELEETKDNWFHPSIHYRRHQRGRKLLEHKLQLLWSVTTGATSNKW